MTLNLYRNYTSNVHYTDDNLKIFVKQEEMLPDSNFHSIQHIHEEIEMMEILDGYLYYNINDEQVKVTKGQIIFVNANQLHSSTLNESEYCKFNVVLIHPSIYSNDPLIYANYAKPIVENTSIDYMIFDQHSSLINAFHHIKQLDAMRSSAYMLGMMSDAYTILQLIYERLETHIPEVDPHHLDDMELLNKMTSYIYKNYADKISLRDIAEYGNVSISKCSRMFNLYTKHSPIDFLNLYRLEIASNLLRSTEQSISQISSSCGFDQQSYFNRMFKKEYGCTPLAYRKHPCDKFVH